jgi:hypothetical protein
MNDARAVSISPSPTKPARFIATLVVRKRLSGSGGEAGKNKPAPRRQERARGQNYRPSSHPPHGRQSVKITRPVSWLGDHTLARLPAASGGLLGCRPPIQLRGSAGISPASRAPDVSVLTTRSLIHSQIVRTGPGAHSYLYGFASCQICHSSAWLPRSNPGLFADRPSPRWRKPTDRGS